MHQISSKALHKVITRQSKNNGSEFTIRSSKSGKDFTYKISRSLYNDKWYTHVYVETNYLSFTKLGHYSGGKIWSKGSIVSTQSALGIAFILEKVESENFELLDKICQVFHLGNCLVCGKVLTDANSIEIGLGPHCRTK